MNDADGNINWSVPLEVSGSIFRAVEQMCNFRPSNTTSLLLLGINSEHLPKKMLLRMSIMVLLVIVKIRNRAHFHPKYNR